MSCQKPKSTYKNVILYQKSQKLIYIGGLIHNRKCGISIQFAPNRIIQYGQIFLNQLLFQEQIQDIKQLKAKYERNLRRNENFDDICPIDKKFEGILQNLKNKGSRIKYSNGSIKEGQFLDNQLNGFGFYKKQNGGIFLGYWTNGSISGYGKILVAGGLKYIGEIQDYQKHGFGVWNWALHDQGNFWDNELCLEDETRYEGFWEYDKRHGYGYTSLPNGKRYEGFFENDRYHGYGIQYMQDRKMYEGEWFNGNFVENNIIASQNLQSCEAYQKYIQAQRTFYDWYYEEFKK